MRKFSQLRQTRRIYEQEIQLQQNTELAPAQGGNQPGAQQQQQQQQQTDQGTQGAQQQQQTDQGTQGAQGDVVKFLSKIFESREMAHVYHLTVRGEEGSNAKHLALGEFYDGILDMLDDIIEVYQGEFGVIEGYDAIDTSSSKSTDATKYFEDLAGFIKAERKRCFRPDDTHYFNIIDDMMVLVYKTLYKLKYTK